jgi:DNA-binding transcriptional ArsR family regulator
MTTIVDVIAAPERAAALLQPTRLLILERLDEPASAASLARALDLPRQRLNYHIQELLGVGLIEQVESRQRGSVTERIYRRSAASYAISADVLGRLAVRPETIADRHSSAHQIAVASRAIAELARQRAAAAAADKSLATISLEVDVRFGDAAARSEFARELTDAIANLARKYHDARTPNGRTFRFYLGGYPSPRDGAP